MRPMRILLVSPYLPYPPSWGSGMRTYQLLRALASDNSVTLLSFECAWQDMALEELEKHCERVIIVPRRVEAGVSKRLRQARCLLSTLPHHAQALTSPAMKAALADCLQEDFDSIQVTSSPMLGRGLSTSTPVVLDEHNVESEVLRRMAAGERSPLRRVYNRIESNKQARLERHAWRSVQACAMPSSRDADAVVAQAPRTLVRVVPNGVDPEYFAPTGADIDPDELVFTGLLSYRPNYDAVRHFINDVRPRIREVRPRTKLTVVGSCTTQGRQSLQADGVVVTGWVEDLRPYLARAAAAVAPIRMGGGTRLKVIEAMSMGKAVVSTTVGCEGLDVVPGQHLLVADGADAFADAIMRLLDDAPLASRLGAAGRDLAVSRYSWQESGRRLLELHQEAVSSAGYERPEQRTAQ